MSTIAQTTSSTVIALLSTVNSSASSAAKLIDTAASSVDMLDRYVQRAKSNQIKTHIIQDHDYITNLMTDAAVAQSLREETIERKLAGNTRLQVLFTENLAQYKALLEVK